VGAAEKHPTIDRRAKEGSSGAIATGLTVDISQVRSFVEGAKHRPAADWISVGAAPAIGKHSVCDEEGAQVISGVKLGDEGDGYKRKTSNTHRLQPVKEHLLLTTSTWNTCLCFAQKRGMRSASETAQ